MNKIDRYLHAATRENTRQSYQAALRHFEVEWGGLLPASPDSVGRYVADHGAMLSISTLRQRLAAIAAWHQEHGFPDPTKNPLVHKVLRGITNATPPLLQKVSSAVRCPQLGIQLGRLRK